MKREETLHDQNQPISKKIDIDLTEPITKTIELVNDSLVISSEDSHSPIKFDNDLKPIMLKGVLANYAIEDIPSYNGVIGDPSFIQLQSASLPPKDLKRQRSIEPISTVMPLTSSKPIQETQSYADEYELINYYNKNMNKSQWLHYNTKYISYIKDKQSLSTLTKDYTLTSDVKKIHRLKLFNWIAELVHNLGIPISVELLTFAIIDNFLSSTHVLVSNLQCLGSAALQVCCKLNSINILSNKKFVEYSLSSFSIEDLTQMEEDILQAFNYDLLLVTVAPFAFLQLADLHPTPELVFLSFYYIECCIIEGSHMLVAPSHIAYICIYTALKTLHYDTNIKLTICETASPLTSEDKETQSKEIQRIPEHLIQQGYTFLYSAYNSLPYCTISSQYTYCY